MAAEEGQAEGQSHQIIRTRQVLDPDEVGAVKIEILREHVEDGDEDGELDEKAQQALQGVQGMDTLFAIQGDGAPHALFAFVGSLDGVDRGLKPSLSGIDLLLQALGHGRQRQEQDLHREGKGDDRDAGMTEDGGQPAEEKEEPERESAQPGPETVEKELSERRIRTGQRAIVQRPRVERVAP